MLLIAFIPVLLWSCGKDEDDGGGEDPLTENTWRVDGRTFFNFTEIPPLFMEERLTCQGSNTDGNSVLFVSFSQIPTAGRSYTVVDVSTADSLLTADQCKVAISNTFTPATIYGSTGRSGDRVIVTVTGGKVKVVFDKIEMFYFRSSTRFTTTASANVTEG